MANSLIVNGKSDCSLQSYNPTNRVGEITSAPISFFFKGDSPRRLISFSRIGITNAKVFPEPVTACLKFGQWYIHTDGKNEVIPQQPHPYVS